MKPQLKTRQVQTTETLQGGYRTEKRSMNDIERQAIDTLQREWDARLKSGWSNENRFLTMLTDYAINDVGSLAGLRHNSPYDDMISTHGSNSVYGTQYVPDRVKNAVKNYVDEQITRMVKRVLRAHLTK